MTIEKAIKLVAIEYATANKLEYIRDPVAYALYKVWKQADSKKRKDKKNETESST